MKRFYWDTNCFIDYLQGTENGQQLSGVVELVKNNKAIIYTSVITITELLKVDGSPDERQKIQDVFSDDAKVVVVELTRFLAEKSRSFIWKHSFDKHKPDAIHLMTAVYINSYIRLDAIHSFDNDLLKFDGDPDIPIVIEAPSLSSYPASTSPLFDDEGNPLELPEANS